MGAALTDEILISRAGANYKATLSEIQALIGGGGGADTSIDPTAAKVFWDDFISGSETGEIGRENWTVATGTIQKLNNLDNHPGVVRLVGTTTANAVRSLFYTNAVGDTISRFDQFDEMYMICRESAAGQTDLTFQFGLFAALGNTAPAHGCYLEIKPADTNYFVVTRNGGVETGTRSDTGIARGATWVKMRVRRITSTQVIYNINGGADIVHNANVPDAADTFNIGMQHAQSGTTARNADIDWASFRILGQTR